MLASMTEGMRNFAQRYNIAINDPRLVKLYQMEQDAIRDEKSRLNFAMSEGLKQGRNEGKLNAHRADAIGMKAEGIAVDVIARITGLSIKEVMAL